MSRARLACQVSGLEKSFGHNRVLRNVDLALRRGEVCVLMGANGAGKSTLVKILSGVLQRDAGDICLFGKPFEPTCPADALKQGIATVHQSIDDGVVPDLDVASNLLLDRLGAPSGLPFINAKRMRDEAESIASYLGLNVDVRAQVRDLGVADRQMIAIARAMTRNPKLLILDEPTSSLSSAESDRLFDFLDRLRSTGVAILYISHRMSDVRRVADSIVAMRDGRIAATLVGSSLNYETAVNAMLGERLEIEGVSAVERGQLAIEFTELAISPGDPTIDLSIYRDEIVAIVGLLGSGKSALGAYLFGLSRPASGTIRIDGALHEPDSPRAAVRAGVFMCPKDRAANAVVEAFDVAGNMALPFMDRYSRLSFLRSNMVAEAASSMISSLGIVCESPADDIGNLSGGNQQKVMIARWLSQSARVLVLDEPFQGVDIKARRDIGARIRETAKGRATVLLVSELDEALEIADRIVVLHEHAKVGEHVNGKIDISVVLAQYSGETDTQTNWGYHA